MADRSHNAAGYLISTDQGLGAGVNRHLGNLPFALIRLNWLVSDAGIGDGGAMPFMNLRLVTAGGAAGMARLGGDDLGTLCVLGKVHSDSVSRLPQNFDPDPEVTSDSNAACASEPCVLTADDGDAQSKVEPPFTNTTSSWMTLSFSKST